jgi:glycosyltransferase involved in cell wall biosynthesis
MDKVLVISDLRNAGGAAFACNRIVNSLRSIETGILHVSSDQSANPREDEGVLFLGRKFLILQQLLHNFLSDRLITKLRNKELSKQLVRQIRRYKPDHVNFHNLHSAGWANSLVWTALNHAPVSWTLHDCWSFSGRYYPSHSPVVDPEVLNGIKQFWGRISSESRLHPLSAVTPSHWMSNQASKSFWNGKTVQTIHNPVPKAYFHSRDKNACKKALGLSESKPIVLSVAGDLDEQRKGGPILKKIIEETSAEDAQFLLIGNETSSRNIHAEKVKSLGVIDDEITLQIAYSAADLLLHPAPIDNLPNTVSESMSSGTPVLAFDTGGLPEMVIHQKSGWLVKEINSESMIKELRAITKSKDFENLRESTRNTASNLFDSKQIARQYLDHFNLLKENP